MSWNFIFHDQIELAKNECLKKNGIPDGGTICLFKEDNGYQKYLYRSDKEIFIKYGE